MIFIKEPSAEWLNYQLTPIKGPAALVLKLLISTAGGRFHFITVQGRHLFKETTFTVSTLPRAWLEPPCASHSGVSRLMGLHYRSSHRRPFAIPAGVAAFRSNQRCSASDFE